MHQEGRTGHMPRFRISSADESKMPECPIAAICFSTHRVIKSTFIVLILKNSNVPADPLKTLW
jgi:hypothetical protein